MNIVVQVPFVMVRAFVLRVIPSARIRLKKGSAVRWESNAKRLKNVELACVVWLLTDSFVPWKRQYSRSTASKMSLRAVGSERIALTTSVVPVWRSVPKQKGATNSTVLVSVWHSEKRTIAVIRIMIARTALNAGILIRR